MGNFTWPTINEEYQLSLPETRSKSESLCRELGPKHLFITLEHGGDFDCLWLKELLFIDDFPMRIFRWIPKFRSDVESSIVPVWIGLPNLPLFMFNKQCLFSIGRLIRQPLTNDIATEEIKWPCLAKICVEVDLSKKLLHRIKLECGDSYQASDKI